MIDVTVDMEQYDCPFIDTTADHPVTFSAIHWQYDTLRDELETRLVVEGDDREALANGLSTLREHPNMYEYDLFSREGQSAVIRTVIDQTNAMQTIREGGGYITGPFFIRDGEELWQVGFDSNDRADDTLSALDRDNEFTVQERRNHELGDLFDLVQNAGAATQLLDACRDLSDVERATLESAIDEAYYDSPRGATLGDLADEFGVSNTAVSKNLRRGERKVMENVVSAMESLD